MRTEKRHSFGLESNSGPMDSKAVAEILGQVPLLQKLPTTSQRKIAELVKIEHYDSGQCVVCKGESGKGLYIFCEGEVVVSGSASIKQEELRLNQNDYFGGTDDFVHQVNVIALSKSTCLVLELKHRNLLQPKSIWNAEGTPEDFSLVEQILHLESLEVDLFRGFTLPDAPAFRQVYGGQLIGQALAAACKTVDCLKMVHSLHASFIIAGSFSPIDYQVYRQRDGKRFASRRVDAKQKGAVIFSLVASFQKEVGSENSEHQKVAMPQVPLPETLLSLEELRERHLTDPRIPIYYRNTNAKKRFVPWPLEIKLCDFHTSYTAPPCSFSLNYWFRVRGKLSDDPALHRCVVAYVSDLVFGEVCMDLSHKKSQIMLTLEHSMWFHKPVKADDWLLFEIESPISSGGRGFSSGRMFNRKGELVATLTQEVVIRNLKPPVEIQQSKL